MANIVSPLIGHVTKLTEGLHFRTIPLEFKWNCTAVNWVSGPVQGPLNAFVTLCFWAGCLLAVAFVGILIIASVTKHSGKVTGILLKIVGWTAALAFALALLPHLKFPCNPF